MSDAQKMSVVMSNDYPAAVFSSEALAEDYCDQLRKEQKEALGRVRVNWRVYTFTVDDATEANRFHATIIQQAGGFA